MTHSRIFTAAALFALISVTGVAPLTAAAPAAPAPAARVLPITGTGYWRSANRPQVTVPAGTTQLVMEQKQGTGWKPVQVRHLTFAPSEKNKIFPVTPPAGASLSQIRMVAYKEAKFPAGFDQGSHTFCRPNPADLSGRIFLAPVALAPINIAFGGTLLTTNTFAASNTASNADSTQKLVTALPQGYSAVESDIWKLSGNQLYFFNQYRGLQVFDMTHPEAPVHTGSLRMAASGDQMYVVGNDDSYVALIGKSTAPEHYGHESLFLVKVTRGIPALETEVPLTGQYMDSRLINNKLYVLSYLSEENDIGSSLYTVDLTNPAAPAVIARLKFSPGRECYLQAAANYLLVSTNDGFSFSPDYTPWALHVIETHTADGTPELVKILQTKGPITDKFKMTVMNNSVVAVTRCWNDAIGYQTWVQTFALDGPTPALLAEVELTAARNETLRATRFDGDRLYVVTFRQIDPLFVVDLSDPAQPGVRGILEIPGWSTYLEPAGDRLLAVGIQSNHVTVSLFGVADINAPSLLSRIVLGQNQYGSWSEATYDEKAVEYFPESGLLMLPVQVASPNGGASKVVMQAIEIGRDELTEGAVISQEGKARRGAVMGQHLISISGQQMSVVKRGAAAAPATPEAELSLAWRVDRVVPFGGYLLQLDDGVTSSIEGMNAAAMLRVTSRENPDHLLEELELGTGRIVGTAQSGSRLFVAQWVSAQQSGKTCLRTWILDLKNPPLVKQITTLDQAVPDANFDWDKVQGLWATDDTLVWYVSAPDRRLWNTPILIGYSGPIFISPPTSIITFPISGVITRPITNPIFSPIANPIMTIVGTTGLLNSTLSFANRVPVTAITPTVGSGQTTTNAAPLSLRPNVVRPQAPEQPGSLAHLFCPIYNAVRGKPNALKPIPVTSQSTLLNASQAFAADGLIYASYDDSIAANRMTIGNPATDARSWLQVVDFRATTPVVRDPVSIPGSLLSIGHASAQGAVVFTMVNYTTSTLNEVQASAYDGLTSYLLDSHSLADQTQTSAVKGAFLYFGHGGEKQGVTALGYDQQSAHLTTLGEWTTPGQPTDLAVAGDTLLASALDAAAPGPQPIFNNIIAGNAVFASPANVVALANIGPDGALTSEAIFDMPPGLTLFIRRNAPTATGTWIPAADYGVEFLH